MNRKLRPSRSTQQVKEEKISFLLEEVKKNLEKHKRATKLKDKQLSDNKKILQGPKENYDSVVNKNTELKKYIENIKQRYQQYQQWQQQEYIFWQRKGILSAKKYLKVVYQKENDSEPEVVDSQYVPEETEEEEIEKPKREKNQVTQKGNNYIFEYSNSEAKRNKQ